MRTRHETALLNKIRNLKGKFKFRYSGKHDGRRVVFAVIRINNDYFYGEAQCSRKDQFNKSIGRTIALGRAFKNFEANDKVIFSENNIGLKFKEDRC